MNEELILDIRDRIHNEEDTHKTRAYHFKYYKRDNYAVATAKQRKGHRSVLKNKKHEFFSTSTCTAHRNKQTLL